MDDRERDYLRAAYDIAKANEMRAFDEHEVAIKLDLDFDQPGWVERQVAVTDGLIEEGLVEGVHKGGGPPRRVLKLTRRGLEAGKRLADPATQRKERRERFLRAIYELADGSPGTHVYFRDVAQELGLAPGTPRPPKEVKGLAEQLAGAGLITIEGDAAMAFRITARGVDEVEGNGSQPQAGVSNVFNIENAQGSVIGTHNKAELTNTFDFRTIEQRIEREGGEDKEELRRALDRVERLVERGDYLDRGALSEFSGAMERHSWFTGAVAQALIGFATQMAG